MDPFVIFVGVWRVSIYFGLIFVDIIWNSFGVTWDFFFHFWVNKLGSRFQYLCLMIQIALVWKFRNQAIQISSTSFWEIRTQLNFLTPILMTFVIDNILLIRKLRGFLNKPVFAKPIEHWGSDPFPWASGYEGGGGDDVVSVYPSTCCWCNRSPLGSPIWGNEVRNLHVQS